MKLNILLVLMFLMDELLDDGDEMVMPTTEKQISNANVMRIIISVR